MCITDSELALIPLEQLQQYTQVALRSFSLEDLLSRAQGFAYQRILELLDGAVPCALEIQQLRSSLGAAFQPVPPAPSATPAAVSPVPSRELLLAEQLQKLERKVMKLRRRLHRKSRRSSRSRDEDRQ